MYEITFKYRDEASNGEWRTQKCYMSSVEECKKVYALDTDPTVYEYEIIEVKEIKK